MVRVTKIAATHAVDVDRTSKFPGEAVAALKAERLFGAPLPLVVGGEGATTLDIAEICFALGRVCSSTAMIFAMHHIQLACIFRHAGDNPWCKRFLAHLAADQLLLAGSTTDAASGGDIRHSNSAVFAEGDRFNLSKAAAVASYAEYADGILVTTRRSPEALASDQVAVVVKKADYTLEKIADWDALGMRGTCSASYRLTATGEQDQVLPAAFSLIHQTTMLPIAHILWSSVWLGIAADALERTRQYVKSSYGGARRAPLGTLGTARAVGDVFALRAAIARVIEKYDGFDLQQLQSFEFQAEANFLKVTVSEWAVEAVLTALRTCGLAGYRNDSPFSVGRHLRDVLSAPLMIGNDRILAGVSAAATMLDLNTRLLK